MQRFLGFCIVGLFAVFPSLPECRGSDPAKTGATKKAQEAENASARLLEKVRVHLEEWGTVTISDPLLLPVSADFDLGPEATFPNAASYIEANRTGLNASVGQFSQSALVGQVGANLQVPGSSAVAPGGSTSANTTAASTGGPGASLPTANARDYLTQPTFAPANTLNASLSGIPERSAVLSGTGDKITERTMRLWANPSSATARQGEKRYFVVYQVTCNPGWRTLKNYMADLQVHFEYGCVANGRATRTSLSEPGRAQPHFLAALPLLDAQNIESRNGQRDLQSLGLALSAAGQTAYGTASGRGLLDFIRSYQSDAASRLALPVVNSYSTGTTIGFRFSPSFQALGNLTKKRSRSENQLVPTSFPVVFLMEIKSEDILADKTERYTHLIEHYSYRWMLRDRTTSIFPWNQPKRRESEMARVKLAQLLDQVSASVNNAYLADERANPEGEPFNHLKSFRGLRQDYFEIEQKAFGRTSFVRLPQDALGIEVGKPVVKKVAPSIVDPDMDTVMVIEGENFGRGLNKFVVIGGHRCDVISSNETSIVAQLPKGLLADGTGPADQNSPPQDGSADVVVITDGGASTEPKQVVVRRHDDKFRQFVFTHTITGPGTAATNAMVELQSSATTLPGNGRVNPDTANPDVPGNAPGKPDHKSVPDATPAPTKPPAPVAPASPAPPGSPTPNPSMGGNAPVVTNNSVVWRQTNTPPQTATTQETFSVQTREQGSIQGDKLMDTMAGIMGALRTSSPQTPPSTKPPADSPNH